MLEIISSSIMSNPSPEAARRRSTTSASAVAGNNQLEAERVFESGCMNARRVRREDYSGNGARAV